MASQRKIRRFQAREKRVQTSGSLWSRAGEFLFSWPTLVAVVFSAGAAAVALVGSVSLGYTVGQRIEQPIIARVDFEVPDPQKTAAGREAARAAVPSYFTPNERELTHSKIRADLMRLYGLAAAAATFQDFQKSLGELGWPADENAFRRLRGWVEMPQDSGRDTYERLVESIPVENEFIVRDFLREPRTPPSNKDFIILEFSDRDQQMSSRTIHHSELIPLGNEKALRGAASELAKRFPADLRPTIEYIILATFKEQPTIVFNQKRTLDAMAEAEKNAPASYTRYVKGKPFIEPGLLTSEDYDRLQAERDAYRAFLAQTGPEARQARSQHYLRRVGIGVIVWTLALGLVGYARVYQPRIFDSRPHSLVFIVLVLGALAAARLLNAYWPQLPELVYTPFLLLTAIFVIVYPQRFALGASCFLAILAVATVQRGFYFLLPLLVGSVVIVRQLDEIRARTKLISVGLSSAGFIMLCSVAAGFALSNPWTLVLQHALWAGVCALLAAFLISGLLPFVEKLFRTATALTLLEWRDPTRPLLQLLAREAPGTYNHSLVLGTLAEAACEKIGANALLAQVGALYHDIGKIPKAQYFTENQDGRINRHDSLAPTMSLLIILGHVKDGLELAREFKLPRILHQFIEEHHGTTVVRYFHHVASEKQAQTATGRHDREVSEAEFRYPGPTPRSRESAVLMLCDGVEGAVRSLSEPTAGRIEGVVHQIVSDRLNDGQFDECDITLREIRQVEESLVKSLIAIYHGRVAYPRAKPAEEPTSRSTHAGVAAG